MKTVSLVLGSGGARGLAHIGVIAELERRDYRIASIAGCSMGALIGGIYAAGELDKFSDWVRGIDKLGIINLLDVAWQSDGLVKGDKIIDKLVDLVGDQQIEDLPMPFTAVATDIASGGEVWISKGRLFDAIRASISLPLFFTPVKRRDAVLIDGGCLNPVPIAPTLGDDTDLTVAVNLNGPPGGEEQAAAAPEQAEPSSTVSRWIRNTIDDLTDSISAKAERDWDAYDVANQGFDAMQTTIARLKMAAYPPDVDIEISRDACGTLEFDRADEMIALGRKHAAEALDRLEQLRRSA
jgi:NTE family protein